MLGELFFSNMSLLVGNSSKIGIFIFCGVVAFNCCGQVLCHELVLPVLRPHFSHQNFPQIKLVDVDTFFAMAGYGCGLNQLVFDLDAQLRTRR